MKASKPGLRIELLLFGIAYSFIVATLLLAH